MILTKVSTDVLLSSAVTGTTCINISSARVSPFSRVTAKVIRLIHNNNKTCGLIIFSFVTFNVFNVSFIYLFIHETVVLILENPGKIYFF